MGHTPTPPVTQREAGEKPGCGLRAEVTQGTWLRTEAVAGLLASRHLHPTVLAQRESQLSHRRGP